jgi:hypothetical protein
VEVARIHVHGGSVRPGEKEGPRFPCWSIAGGVLQVRITVGEHIVGPRGIRGSVHCTVSTVVLREGRQIGGPWNEENKRRKDGPVRSTSDVRPINFVPFWASPAAIPFLMGGLRMSPTSLSYSSFLLTAVGSQHSVFGMDILNRAAA